MGVALALLLVAAVLIGLWLFPTPQFPEPTGPYRIGTVIYPAWTDEARPEPFTAAPDDRRQLVVQIWYPTTHATGPAQRYIQDRATTSAVAARFKLPAVLLRRVERAPTHAVANASAAEGRFPVLLHPAGFSAFRDSSLFWIEALVSHGYVVIGFDQPGAAAATVLPGDRVIPAVASVAEFKSYMPLALSQAPNKTPVMNGVSLPGGVIPFLADDLRFVLDRLEMIDREDRVLAGHLDLTRVGAFGLSLGGYAAGQACYRDQRIRACVIADAGQAEEVARNGLRQPVMIFTRDAGSMRRERAQAGGWPEPEIAHTINDQRAVFERSQSDAYYLTMNGMHHLNWTDAPLWSPITKWRGLAGPIDPYRGFELTNAYTVAFFDRYLKGRDSPLLAGSQVKSDVRIEVRRQ